MKGLLNKILRNNKGSGLGVVLYGITLLLVLIFTAINMVNSKVIENGYNSLRDAVHTSASGSVMHLLTTNRSTTSAQSSVIRDSGYDIYLQLALGYLVNRYDEPKKGTSIIDGEINNFIKLDHQKVVNTTLSVLEDAVIRKDKKTISINRTDKFKIMMFFIEPYESNGNKYFEIIAYGNGDYNEVSNTIESELVKTAVRVGDNMEDVYTNVQDRISNIVNCVDDGMDEVDKERYKGNTSFRIELNPSGSKYDKLIREMQTYPHYIIVVKDFALPTIFDGKDTNDDEANVVKRLFTGLSGDGSLSKPMCALNTGKVERQFESAGWSKKR